ncbi:MAG: hypothetical protein IPJ88_15145 [Myxococcales bacterium]|nr:MAG: hypothetical protein IPJ88_15145 [Myxococcales bacterium]
MVRRHKERIALPWEGQLVRLGDLLGGRRLRVLLMFCLIGATVIFLSHHIEERSRIRTTWAVIHQVEQALYSYRIEQERCPPSILDLIGKEQDNEFGLRAIPRDGWGRELKIVCPNKENDAGGIVVMSAGPSGSFLVNDNLY